MPRLVSAEFKAAAAGRIPPERLKEIVEPLDHKKFLTADGSEVDADKVSRFVAGVLGDGVKEWPDMGQGRRGAHSAPAGVAAGRDLFSSRHTKKK
jgi:hypothetical protein